MSPDSTRDRDAIDQEIDAFVDQLADEPRETTTFVARVGDGGDDERAKHDGRGTPRSGNPSIGELRDGSERRPEVDEGELGKQDQSRTEGGPGVGRGSRAAQEAVELERTSLQREEFPIVKRPEAVFLPPSEDVWLPLVEPATDEKTKEKDGERQAGRVYRKFLKPKSLKPKSQKLANPEDDEIMRLAEEHPYQLKTIARRLEPKRHKKDVRERYEYLLETRKRPAESSSSDDEVQTKRPRVAPTAQVASQTIEPFARSHSVDGARFQPFNEGCIVAAPHRGTGSSAELSYRPPVV
ncbi:hypothetical protein JCM10212_001400 [Sporobolomyces blumeae]